MRRVALVAACVGLFVASGAAKEEQDLTDAQAQEIIQKFAAKEAEFQRAREAYTYRQSVRVQELDESRRVRGKYEVVTDIIFSPEGKRTERVVHAPVATLVNLQLTPEDEQDLRSVQPFVLTTAEIPKYYIRYLGRQTLDEIPCYSFAVKPKEMVKGERYFSGIVWVDDRDMQIVKTYGRGVGVQRKGFDNQFPKFETYRQQIDGKYWFPTYTVANDVLAFKTGPQPIKMLVKYEDYKRFGADTTITFGQAVEGGGTPEKQPEQVKPEEQKPAEKPKQ